MRVNLYLQLRDIVSDFTQLLREKSFPVLRRENEPPVENFDSSFTPLISEKIVEQVSASVCTLCSRRISYKHGQFEMKKHPALPYLILLHNPFLSPTSGFFHDQEVNSLFRKMIETSLGSAPEKFLIREILRCHFSKEDQSDPDWVNKCSSHILTDIQEFKIRGILIVGQAAALLFPDKDELSKKSGKIISMHGLPALVMPGPNRLVFMREKNHPKDKIDAERKLLFNMLVLFKKEIMKL